VNDQTKANERVFVIFDYDGTLVDSVGDIAEAINNTRAQFGLDHLSISFVRGLIGDGMQKFLKDTVSELGEREFAKAREVFVKTYQELSAKTTCLYPGIKDLLDKLKADSVAMAVVSNKPQMMLDKINKTLGLEHYFRVALGGDAYPQRKPDPKPLLEARRLSGFSSETAIIMIGDGAQDLKAAKAAGATSIWVSWGMCNEQPGPSDYVVNSPLELETQIRLIYQDLPN